MGNLAARLLRAAAADPAKAALVTSDASVAYGELAADVARARGALLTEGIKAGDRVGLLLQGPDFVVAYLATLGIGAIVVPLNHLSPRPELARSIGHTETTAVLADDALAGTVEGLGARVMPPDALRTGEARPEGVDVDDDSAAVLMMTSGTTGEPRAAILTHGSLRANLDQLDSHPRMRSEAGDIGLAILPFFHIFGLNVGLGYALYSGTSIAFPREQGGAAWLAAIKEFGATVVLGTPQVFAGWVGMSPGASALASLRVAVSGAAPLPPGVFEGFRAEFGKPLWEGYGLTEASPVVSSTRMDDEPVEGSVGHPLPGVEVEIRGTDSTPVAIGDPGEIFVRGKNVFAGYFHDEEATRDAIQDGWLKTGDIGLADEEGHLFLVDRSRDIIIVSGFNVFPAEVEEVLESHPAVSEAAVVSRPSPRTGEEIVAYVVTPSSSSLESAELREHCASRLSRYKVPAEVKVVDSLPHTMLGKVRRGAVR